MSKDKWCRGSGDGRSSDQVINRRTICSSCGRQVGIVERGRWARANQPFQVAHHQPSSSQPTMFTVRWRLDLSSTEAPDHGVTESWVVLADSAEAAIEAAKAVQLEATTQEDIDFIERSMPGKTSWSVEPAPNVICLGTSTAKIPT